MRFTNPITGATYIQGYVQVQHNGEWGSICDDNFEDNHNGANVVCKMMGYAYGTYSTEYKQIPIATQIKPTILLDNVICKGSETSITQCAHSGWDVHDCRHSEAVGVNCGKFKQAHHTGFT